MLKSPSFKLVLVFFLSLILLIPILMVQSKIEDRADSQREAQYAVSQHWTGEQWLGNAIIAIPYQSASVTQNGGRKLYKQWKLLIPETIDATGEIIAENRKKGIYEIPIYRVNIQQQGRFKRTALQEALDTLAADPQVEHIGKPFITLGIADMRGLEKQTLKINGKNHLFQAGSELPALPQGLHLPLPADINTANPESPDIQFRVELGLKGMSNFYFLPMAKQSTLALDSNWPHPKYSGAQLPAKHDTTDSGFSAHWKSNHYALNGVSQIEECLKYSNCHVLDNKNHFMLGVDLINPVDIYLKTERALKYAFLLIGLSFMVFFIVEHIRALAMHPIQYGFAGLAIATFYLLLLALSEHLGFALSYLIAVIACSILLYSYLHIVLKNQRLAGGFVGGLIVLWTLLYIIIQAEDFALLMGSLLVFGLLSILMVGTRSIDWYALGGDKKLLDRKPSNKTINEQQAPKNPEDNR
ncbi:cell envelope integrity protein CreD [Pseudoteredinibacter isoporae]|uniref:Inner membrane protein n=1 Tax=Pseudoteredinibacter isoporae TaxID=570281 RepID=A0A7X0MZ56_9GAMM|nr:cell envelope integrity protein CreD [Pseudoteredinibacter isoporae]MBB6523804.1 inner membrane protein [Pseudoteredinibacter isoporae]NHO89324.1 cell envelope integrity protein CreD [Pseudoteredinibacter isoporae]NIB22431.1 cell envelope integrity protein CreD [Pseudoteredinibacter isoporae]